MSCSHMTWLPSGKPDIQTLVVRVPCMFPREMRMVKGFISGEDRMVTHSVGYGQEIPPHLAELVHVGGVR